MIPSTQEVLIYREGAEKPDSVPWGTLYEENKHDPAWIREVEDALNNDRDWEDPAGHDGILRIALSRIWRE